MEYNKAPISLRDGHVYLDGVEILDTIKCDIKFTPDVWEGRSLGDLSPNTRWLGYKITGTIGRRRSTRWLEKAIKSYIDSHETPEMTITGVMDDHNSDYYKEFGASVVTCVGVVLTGDLPLTLLDSGGDVVEDSISFNAKEIII